MVKFSKILVTTDLSETSKNVFSLAIDLAKAFKSKIVLVHVFEEDLVAVYPMIVGYMQPEMIETGKYQEEAREGARQALEKIRGELEKSGVTVETILRAGAKPFVEIVRIAREIPADLIIMATHGRTGLSHALIGSTAERVVRKAHCPVLTVKPEGLEFTAP